MIAAFLLILLAPGVLTLPAFAQSAKLSAATEYRSPNGSHARVSAVDKLKGFESYESRIEFYNASGKKICTADYSSQDGDHGFGVAKAEWSPDGRFFVYSMTSSGGHQPWHAPTNFYDGNNHELCSLDAFLDPPGIATPDFLLGAPNLITTFIYGKQNPSSTRLDRIQEAGARDGQPRCVPCDKGVVHEFGDNTLYVHSPK